MQAGRRAASVGRRGAITGEIGEMEIGYLLSAGADSNCLRRDRRPAALSVGARLPGGQCTSRSLCGLRRVAGTRASRLGGVGNERVNDGANQ